MELRPDADQRGHHTDRPPSRARLQGRAVRSPFVRLGLVLVALGLNGLLFLASAAAMTAVTWRPAPGEPLARSLLALAAAVGLSPTSAVPSSAPAPSGPAQRSDAPDGGKTTTPEPGPISAGTSPPLASPVLGGLVEASSETTGDDGQTYPARNAADGNRFTYWESDDGAGSWFTTCGQSTARVSRIVLSLPPEPKDKWNVRYQTIEVQASPDGSTSTYTRLVEAKTYAFDAHHVGNETIIDFPGQVTAKCIRLVFVDLDGWEHAQLGEIETFAW